MPCHAKPKTKAKTDLIYASFASEAVIFLRTLCYTAITRVIYLRKAVSVAFVLAIARARIDIQIKYTQHTQKIIHKTQNTLIHVHKNSFSSHKHTNTHAHSHIRKHSSSHTITMSSTTCTYSSLHGHCVHI